MKLSFSPKPETIRFWMDEQVWAALRVALIQFPAGDNEQREVLGRTIRQFNKSGVMSDGDPRDPNVQYNYPADGCDLKFEADQKKIIKRAWDTFTPNLPGKYNDIIDAVNDKLAGKTPKATGAVALVN